MRIGFVSTWFERGAAYVTKQFRSALQAKNETFIYARGGEMYAKGDPNWDGPEVTWGLRLFDTSVSIPHILKWIDANKIQLVFFNEQHDIEPVLSIKKQRPHVIVGTYVDYYKESTVSDFRFYDFLICNTRRHYSVFQWHPQCFYIPWGTDLELFSCTRDETDRTVRFFHSVGMSNRKGTEFVIESFIKGKLYKEAKLIIHTQVDISKTPGIDISLFSSYNIEYIHASVPAPGLYHKGNVYVYPTKLDGLGLTIYEALSCGMPVITTDNAPMNEIVNNDIGKLIPVEKFVSRTDGYYWPLSIVNTNELIKGMRYYIENADRMYEFGYAARDYATKELNWNDRRDMINEVFGSIAACPRDITDISAELKRIRRKRRLVFGKACLDLLPVNLQHLVYSRYNPGKKKDVR
ncbi:MAG: glycosyltransferase family 4 protein [SAR324 cluster bacterium]|uniref:Glycosyltransferase family 4 protein n=1 Tax=SAR324 cluster bacterium TaxID=2024889 RepID=A0A7X9FU51_9DELT|nr:glycosyltransferase family 4 protein [SAR324 cluster bacterium]